MLRKVSAEKFVSTLRQYIPENCVWECVMRVLDFLLAAKSAGFPSAGRNPTDSQRNGIKKSPAREGSAPGHA
jgi:uncharacterized protein YutD